MNLDKDILNKITYLAGSPETIESMPEVPAKIPFDADVISFLTDVSKILMADKRSRQYPDIITFAFWIRAASIKQLKERYMINDGNMRFGRGVAFHIAPSNVPVNFAYSLVAGLLAGNSNIVRVPSKAFEQIKIIADSFHTALERNRIIKAYIALIRYERDKAVNDLLSGIADIRIIWGGDATIAELRSSPLPPRSTEITFADRYSLAVIDSDVYLNMNDKKRVAEDFYNDTFLSDQNACTSPKIVIWTGNKKTEAKRKFWDRLHDIVIDRYKFQDIQGVNKLTSSYLAAVAVDGANVIEHKDNFIIRISIPKVNHDMMDLTDNSGYFFEYDCDDVLELRNLCNDKRCQTIGILGDKKWLTPLMDSGIKGIDRVVDIGHTMDFDLIWDGYELISQMTRAVKI